MTDASLWGVLPGHHDVRGVWIDAPPHGVSAALAAMHASESGPEAPLTWVVRRDRGIDVPDGGWLETENGDAYEVRGHVAELPLGYHRLDLGDRSVVLIVSPGACPSPPRAWGWAVQLYATRSAQSWGIGDLGDLRALAAWPHAGRILLVNPLHAVAPTFPQAPSPYAPASRRWRNPIYLRVEDVPGASSLTSSTIDDLGRVGRALNASRHIDRDEAWRLKRSALEAIWEHAQRASSVFDAWARDQTGLQGFSTWAALAEDFGPDWRSWPPRFRRPDDPAVAQWAAANRERVRFHAWLQWLVAAQLEAVTGPAVVTDVAIGAAPGGADTWLWQDVVAGGVTIGAPPDDFNPAGQDWGLPPFDPWRLRATAYQPFVEVVRAAMETGGGVRIDHVAGLFRAFWVPDNGSPADGVYVRYPWEDLLNIVALEAHRAGAFVVGEDLGTVEDFVRPALAAAGVLSYRVLWFEDDPPSTWPELALAAVTTHDLPTVSGVWTGADDAARAARGLAVDHHGSRRMYERCAAVVGTPQPVSLSEVVVPSLYRSLSAAPPVLVVGSLDDALGVDERPNHPGTIDEWPNWRLALPAPLETVLADGRVVAAADALASGARRSR